MYYELEPNTQQTAHLDIAISYTDSKKLQEWQFHSVHTCTCGSTLHEQMYIHVQIKFLNSIL